MEVQRIIKEAEQTAIQLLTRYRPKLDALVAALLESEDLEREAVAKILGERPVAARSEDQDREKLSPDSGVVAG
jgi:ATP-dependent Zn protease